MPQVDPHPVQAGAPCHIYAWSGALDVYITQHCGMVPWLGFIIVDHDCSKGVTFDDASSALEVQDAVNPEYVVLESDANSTSA